MRRMKKIRSKMMAGLFLVFMVSFVVLMINFGANQRIVKESKSLLKDNYPSVKYAFNMLGALDELNTLLIRPGAIFPDSISPDTINLMTDTYLGKLDQNIHLQENNITEPGEKELTELLRRSFDAYQKSIVKNEFSDNFEIYHNKYLQLREYILSIHNLNVTLLESKNEDINREAIQILNIQEKVGIGGLTVLAILTLLLPMVIIKPIEKLTERMMNFYKTNFDKEIDIKANHELEKLEEIFESIVMETKSGKKDSEQSKV